MAAQVHPRQAMCCVQWSHGQPKTMTYNERFACTYETYRRNVALGEQPFHLWAR